MSVITKKRLEKAKKLAQMFEDCKINGLPSTDFCKKEGIGKGYIWLRHLNIADGKVDLNFLIEKEITEYSHLFIGKGKIYENGYSEI